MKHSILAVIPARYDSTRFPGKPLALIAGREMILRVCDRVSKCKEISEFIVATDDQRIFDCVSKADYPVMITAKDHASGTDRLVEVARAKQADYILNIQGDEPFLDSNLIDEFLRNFPYDCKPDSGTMASPLTLKEDAEDPNVVKVVTTHSGMALYFSRSLVPFVRDGNIQAAIDSGAFFRHIGIYLYSRDSLLKFPTLKTSTLENLEKLEQLRLLESGGTMWVYKTPYQAIGIDTPHDLKKAEQWFAQQGELE